MISVSTESRLAPSVRPKTIGYAVQRLVTRKRQFPDKMRVSLHEGHAREEVEKTPRLTLPQGGSYGTPSVDC